MLDIRMKDENISWQEWYEKNPRPRKYKLMACYREDVAYAVKARVDKLRYDAKFGLETTRLP